MTATYLPAVRYGGPIRSVHGLCVALAGLGHEVHVFTTNVDGAGNSDVLLGQPVDIEGVKVWYFPCRILRRLYWSPQMKKMLSRQVSYFDIVHLHAVFLWPMWAAARIAEESGVPYVVSPRGMLVKDLVQRKSKWIKWFWIKYIEQRTLTLAEAIHVTTQKELDEVRQFDFTLPSVLVIPNGVDGPKIESQNDLVTCGDGKEYALFLGRINWKKGLDRLIRAWQYVPDVTLVIAGNDEDNYQRELMQMAAKSGIAKQIRFIGMVQGASKWRLFRGAKLFVLPSYSENFGISVLEAMSMGCPVIVTPEVGLADAVAESGAGLVVAGDSKVLGRAIEGLWEDADRRREMGANGQRLVTSKYSWPLVAVEMASGYEKIIAEHA